MTHDPRYDAPGPVSGSGAGVPSPSETANASRSASDGDGPRPATENGGTAPLADDAAEKGAEQELEAAASAEGVDVVALAARAERADEYLALAQRTQADFENFRKRAARESAAATQRGAARLAKELLPAVDNLERALQHAPEVGDDQEDAFVAGVKHVHADLVAALQRAGIERYSPEGEPFDPTLHEAVAQQPFEGYAAGTVVEVYQRGYRIGDSVVRPARVIVAG